MRVKIATNAPLPPLRAWFPLAPRHGETTSSLKSLLCTSLAAFRDVSPASLRLSIDGFELLDHSELTVVRDGDLISIDVSEVTTCPLTQVQTTPTSSRPRTKHGAPSPSATASRKRKRTPSTSSGSESDTESSSSSESESESESASKSETSDSGSESDVSSVSLVAPRVRVKERVPVAPTPKLQPSTFVPPGYGKPQTRSRNLRRRLRRQHEREAATAGVSSGRPVSGANAVAPDEDTQDANGVPTLMSLSLRNKNKAKNFKSLAKKPLPPKIIFDDQEEVSTTSGVHDAPRLIPPSMRSSLPPNVFVTSVDVEADTHTEKSKRKYEVDDDDEDVDRIEATANFKWDTLARVTRSVTPGTLVGHKALGIDPVTFTPGHVLSVGRAVSCQVAVLVVRPLRAVSFNWQEKAEVEEHPWEEIESGDWRVL